MKCKEKQISNIVHLAVFELEVTIDHWNLHFMELQYRSPDHKYQKLSAKKQF